MNSDKDALADFRVLMYHRVAPPGLDPWRLCVSPERFARQLEALTNQFEIISLAEVPYRDHFQNTIALTFDDGYSDNLQLAKPILEEYGVPATVFVTTAYVNAGREFWWDELEQIFLLPGDLPEVLHLSVAGSEFHYEFQSAPFLSEDQAEAQTLWKVTWDGRKPPTERHELFLAIWNLLVGLNENPRNRAIEYLFGWSGVERVVRPTHQPLGAEGLTELIKGGLVQIGSHTVTHPDLTALSWQDKTSELTRSKRALESLLGVEVKTMAYPHGRYDLETLTLTRDAGYQMAFGTGKPEVRGFDRHFQISRTMVLDQNIDSVLRSSHQQFVPRG